MTTTNMSQQSVSVGTNLDGVTYYSTQLPFVDVFKASSPWITQKNGTWDTKEANQLDLDANGWVKSLPQPGSSTDYTQVGTLMNRVGGQYPGGRYVVLYDGEGTLNYGFDAKRNIAASTPGRDVIDVTPSNAGIHLTLTATDPNKTGNYIRNIRVVPEAYEKTYQTQIFNSELIEKIDDFSSFRFMDWMRTNGSNQGDWNNRPRAEDATYASGKGVPIEIMIELANRTGKDPWFTIPHEATDEYVTNFAKLVKAKLNPDLKAHVEYSNEVWNGMFEQHKWVSAQASQEGMQWYEWYARRTEQIGDIWDKVLGNDRVVTVLSGQSGNPWVAEQGLKTVQKYDPNYTVDTLAIAPYISLRASKSNAAEIESWTKEADGGLSKVFQEINQGGVLSNGKPGGALESALNAVTKHDALADQYGLELAAYEGGQHLDTNQDGTENNKAITDLFMQANRDPRMGEVYRQYLEGLKERNLDQFMNFVAIGAPSRWGSWGALESVGQEGSPKYNALIDFIRQNTPTDLVPVDPILVDPTPTEPAIEGTPPTEPLPVDPTPDSRNTPPEPDIGNTPLQPLPLEPTAGSESIPPTEPDSPGSDPIVPVPSEPTPTTNLGSFSPSPIDSNFLTAIPDTATTTINTPIAINVLENDTLSDGFSFSLVNRTDQGTVEIRNNGTLDDPTDDFILYTPHKNASGNDEFTYQLNVNQGNGTTAKVSISIVSTATPSTPEDSQPSSATGGRTEIIPEESGVIDLNQVDLNQDGQMDAAVSLSFSNIKSDARYKNSVGFYAIANAQGDVVDPVTGRLVQPGESEYARVALQQRLQDTDLTRNTGDIAVRTSAGTLIAPYLVANGTPEQYLSQAKINSGKISHAYFAFLGANSDKKSHIRTLNGNNYVFEDMWGGGDRDFNDFAFKVTAQPA